MLIVSNAASFFLCHNLEDFLACRTLLKCNHNRVLWRLTISRAQNVHMQWCTAIRVFVLGTALSGLVVPALFSGQDQSSPSQVSNQQKTSRAVPTDANQFVRLAIYHSIEAEKNDHTHWRYRFHREDEKNNYDRDVVETDQGELARTLLLRGQPLNSEDRKRDEERMQKLVSSEEERTQRAKRMKEDGDKAQQMFKAIPDAFDFKYDGTEDGMVRLTFYPKANYDPPSRELKIFRSMSGSVLIEPDQHRLARIDGRLFEDVTFGWGFLARLNKGGTFRVTQQEVAPGHWEIVGLDVSMSGHAILFKNISFTQHETKSEFRRVPDGLTLTQAYRLLEKNDGAVSATVAPVAKDHATPQSQSRKTN
jgi:hypothetical protein